MKTPTRDEALELLQAHTQSDALRKHALAVEAAMRQYARRFNENADLWGAVGLLHDFDYEQYPTPEEHPYKGAEILRARGYDEAFVKAIMSHAPYTNVPRDTLLEKTLFAVDELCGLVTAVALVRPSKRLSDVGVSSVKKKLKDKAFARSVDRSHIREGTAVLGVDLDDHIEIVLTAMKGISEDLGL